MDKRTQAIIDWIKQYFIENGPDAKAIIGISGGKDSTVVGKLLCEALGPENVVAVKMPQGEQHDINAANAVIKYLNIPTSNIFEINIKQICDSFYDAFDKAMENIKPSMLDIAQVKTNLPARIRMTILYAIAAKFHGRVVNTCNSSENYIGYSTKFGDSAGDFSPLHNYTVREVLEIGKDLGIPSIFLTKPPEDGLSGLTDEANLGFSYEILDAFLLENIIPDYEIYKTIKRMNNRNTHKVRAMPIAPYMNREGKFIRR